MKRTKFLALVLVVAVMLMGAGYAYWTERITVNGTVSTGILDVDCENEVGKTFSNTEGTVVDDKYSIATILPHIPAGGSTANNDDDPARTVTITNLYPDSRAVASFSLVNKSTMAVKMADPLFYVINDTENLVQSGMLDVFVTIKDKAGNIGTYELRASNTPIDLKKNRDNSTSALTNLLDKNDKFDVEIVVVTKSELTNREGKSISFVFNPLFVQFNDNTTYTN